MSCMCGDLYCPSCGPAQGSDLESEAAFNWVHNELEKFLKPALPDRSVSNVALYCKDTKADINSALPYVDLLLDSGEESGMVRLTSFVLDLMRQYAEKKLAESRPDPLPADVPDWESDYLEPMPMDEKPTDRLMEPISIKCDDPEFVAWKRQLRTEE